MKSVRACMGTYMHLSTLRNEDSEIARVYKRFF